MKAAIYARVSTEDQHCEMQLAELGGLAERMGWQSDIRMEQESTRKRRPVLEQLLKDAQQRKFDVVLCWKLDRFGRTMRELVANIELLDRASVRFMCPGQGIDTDQRNPASRLLLHILASVAEFERDLIRERTKAGVAQAKRAGKHCGRPAKVFDREKARKLRERGLSWRDIGKRMGVSHMTVKTALKSGVN